MPANVHFGYTLLVYPGITYNKPCVRRYTFAPHPFRLHLYAPWTDSMDMPLEDVIELVNMMAG